MSNFQQLEVVSRYRDPQPQVVENLYKLTRTRVYHLKDIDIIIVSLTIHNAFCIE